MKKTLCFILSIWMMALLGSCQKAQIEVYYPIDNTTISNNTPVMAWEKVPCDEYQVWIDGVKMATLPSSHNSYVPFPLSFGKHNWEVWAIDDDKVAKSKTETFTIDDRPLVDIGADDQLLRNDWQVISSVQAGTDGSIISQPGVKTDEWAKTSVPATVLTALVRNGVYPNPYVEMNNMRIPDMNDEYNEENDLLKYSHIPGVNPWKDFYWYRTEFDLSPTVKGNQIWLNFGELNYRADIWLNGHKIADKEDVVGMERHYRFDVTPYIKSGHNVLAVAIYPPDIPGKPDPDPVTPLGNPGQNMGDGMISQTYSKWDTMGWDWQPAIRDRDMGITEDVFISSTNDIELADLYVTSDIALPDTTRADLTISARLLNHSSQEKSGNVKVTIANGIDTIRFEQPYVVEGNSCVDFKWDKSTVEALQLTSPQLWWPVGYGNPNLYEIEIIADDGASNQSALKDKFGVRKIETYVGDAERVFKVNGQPIYLRGGNWVIDMMLNWNASRYEKEMELTKNSNLNILRVWGPTGVPPKPFFRAADENGILIWQDFLNDYWGTFKNTPGYQPEVNLYQAITEEIVKNHRNHPSLVIWCGGNEGVNPREDIIVNEILATLDDRDSRYYLKQSDGDGLHGGGPYHTLQPKEYFTHPKLHGFSSEIGPSGLPVFESVNKFLLHPVSDWYPGRFPLDSNLAFHDANNWPGEDTRKFTAYDDMLRHYYGDVDTIDVRKGLEEYLNKAQIVNYDAYRASIESINRNLWDKSSGILLWKSNSSWPSMTWQIYDWYLQSHAGYFGAKKAAENLHVQMNRGNGNVVVMNMSTKPIVNARLEATVYDLQMRELSNESLSMDVPSNSVLNSPIFIAETDSVTILKLKLLDEGGKSLAENVYWLQENNDFTDLNSLEKPQLAVKVEGKEKPDGERTKFTLSVKNEGSTLAFMVNFRMVGEKSRLEFLPSFWSDNFITLLPGEERQIDVWIYDEDISETPSFEYSSYPDNTFNIIK